MRARAIREGSVGLLILIGVGLFGGLVLWLRGLNPGNRNYNMVVTFKDTAGMQVGTAVRYRGVPVGRVIDIQPSSNEVDVRLEITQASLRIPEEDLRVAANQSGFIGETTIDITPMVELTEAQQDVSPTASDCEAGAIICDGDQLAGVTGVSYESLLRSAETLATALADPELISSLKATLNNTTAFTEEATKLTTELTELTLAAQSEVAPLSDSVQQATNSAAAAAQEFQLTATDVRGLLAANRLNLTTTISNISQGSERLSGILDNLANEIEDPQLVEDLRALSANAAEASANFRDASVDIRNLTGSINQPANVLLLQQTLDSARDVFQGAQKVLSDVDQLTGDPAIRNNIRDLIYGLSDLLSSAEILERQAQVAVALGPLEQQFVAPGGVAMSRTDYQALQQQLARLAAAETATAVPPATE
ncbi:MAG: MlaD family protein [Leptolyngbyaceae cyanobacterium]